MRRLALPTLAASGCAGAAQRSRADSVGTTWCETCAAPQIATAYVRLDADGTMAWSYASPDSVRADTMQTWAVDRGALVVSWNLGRAVPRYSAGRDPSRMVADTSTFCVDEPPVVTRIR